MNTVTAATLVLRVQQDCNIEGAAAKVTPQEIVDRLNRAKRKFYDVLRSSGGAGYFKRTSPLATQAGVTVYQTPPDLVSLSYVLAYLTPTQFLRCTPFTDEMRPMFSTILGTGWVFGQPVYYQMADSGTIELLPIPTGQFSVVLGFQYVPGDFILDPNSGAPAGQMDDVNGWSEGIVADACAGVARKMKQWDLANAMAGVSASELDRVRMMAPLRDMGASEVQRDVMATHNLGYWADDVT
jgi:hypothetical protein